MCIHVFHSRAPGMKPASALLQAGAVASANLAAALVDALVEGARLHCFIDTGSRAALSLPCTTFIRKDGWLDWEV